MTNQHPANVADSLYAVKKAVYGFQSVDQLLASITDPVKLTLLVTADTLPQALQGAPAVVKKVAEEYQAKSGGKFTFEMVNPDAPLFVVSCRTGEGMRDWVAWLTGQASNGR